MIDDRVAVEALVEKLEYLPLAIAQAAAFINNNDISISEYLVLLENIDAENELFNEHFADSSRYREMDSTIAKTWHISFNQIRMQDPLAAEYLLFIACIDRIGIPPSLLPSRGSCVQQTKALGTLIGYAFLTQRQETNHGSYTEKLFDMHRLVHISLIWWLEEHDERNNWIDTAASRIELLVPYGGYEGKETWAAYLPHTMRVAELMTAIDSLRSASVLHRLGWCSAELGQYSVAESAFQQALALRKEALGLEHMGTLSSMSGVARILRYQGKFDVCESMSRQVLTMRKKVLGHKHGDTLTSMSDLASIVFTRGGYTEAESMHRQALVLKKEVFGPEHLHTFYSAQQLALTLIWQGKTEEAESINREILAAAREKLGAEHPFTLEVMGSLSLSLFAQRRFQEAQLIQEDNLKLCKKVYGPEHPQTLTGMCNLASTLSEQGRHEEAQLQHEDQLALCKKVHGPEHPNTVTSMGKLSHTLRMQGKYEAAQRMQEDELALSKKVYGLKHQFTSDSVRNLAAILQDQGNYEEAESLQKQMLPHSDGKAPVHKISRLSRGLAKLGISRSRLS